MGTKEVQGEVEVSTLHHSHTWYMMKVIITSRN